MLDSQPTERLIKSLVKPRKGLDSCHLAWYNILITNNNNTQGNTMMMTIENATVETLDSTQARPMGKTVLSVTIGDHTFDMPIDEDELIQALASQYK